MVPLGNSTNRMREEAQPVEICKSGCVGECDLKDLLNMSGCCGR
jgi:hypothetical protein